MHGAALCGSPNTRSGDTHTHTHTASPSPPFSLLYHLSLQKTPPSPSPAPPPPYPPLPGAPSGLQSYLLTDSESFVASFQFLTFRLEPDLLPQSANKQENALSEKTVLHRWEKKKGSKVGGFRQL